MWDPTQATKTALGSVGARVLDLNSEIAVLDTQLRELVAAAAPRTMALFAVSTQHAAQLLITAGGNPHRLRSEAAFAALCAANPFLRVAARPPGIGSTRPATATPTRPCT
jgi:hypothetical protein